MKKEKNLDKMNEKDLDKFIKEKLKESNFFSDINNDNINDKEEKIIKNEIIENSGNNGNNGNNENGIKETELNKDNDKNLEYNNMMINDYNFII